MARRSEHSLEQIREMVLSTAERIVSEQGIQALTVRKIALEIGYTVGSIYMVFANMEDLILHINVGTLDELAVALTPCPQQIPVEQQITQMAAAYLDFASRHFNRWRIIFEQGVHKQADYPEWYQEKVELMFAPIEALFKDLNPQSSAEQRALAARTLWCGVHGVCILALQGNLGQVGPASGQNAVQLLVESFVTGWKQNQRE